jgi:DNA-directed RNA polymerase specialized sigma24 family protein
MQTKTQTNELNATTILNHDAEREVVWRCVFIGQSQREVADVFEVSQGTISNVMQEWDAEHTGEMEIKLIDDFDGVVEPYE